MRFRPILAQLGLHATLRPFWYVIAETLQLLIKPIDALDVDGPTISLQQDMDTAISARCLTTEDPQINCCKGGAQSRRTPENSERREAMRARGTRPPADRRGDSVHRGAGAAVPHARLVVVQRLDEIFLTLAGEPRNGLGRPRMNRHGRRRPASSGSRLGHPSSTGRDCRRASESLGGVGDAK